MNRITWKYFFLLSLAVAMPTAASDLTIPNSFTSGTPAVAAEVNANFTAVETAVDDNDGRVTTLEGAMSDKVDASGDVMTGDLTVPRIAYSSPRTHYAAIPGDSFRPRSNVDYYCGYGMGGARIDTDGSTERLVAPAYLPHGARITEMTIHIYDNDASNDLDAKLFMESFENAYYPRGNTVTTTGASTTTQILTNTLTTSTNQVNNTSSGIIISVGPALGSSWTTGSTLLMVRGATIAYTISEAD